MDGPRRFGELLDSVPGLHDRLLSERLKELEGEGIVTRRVYSENPVRVEYQLTPMGRDLVKALREIHHAKTGRQTGPDLQPYRFDVRAHVRAEDAGSWSKAMETRIAHDVRGS